MRRLVKIHSAKVERFRAGVNQFSSCGEQTCEHAIIFFKHGMKPTVREATQNSSHLKGRLGSIVTRTDNVLFSRSM